MNKDKVNESWLMLMTPGYGAGSGNIRKFDRLCGHMLGAFFYSIDRVI